VGGNDFSIAERLADQVVLIAGERYPDGTADVSVYRYS
jgi:hypothetical protein